MLRQVETMLCVKEFKSLGADAFRIKYGQKDPMAACRTAQQTAAQALIDSAKSACTTAKTRPACMKRNLIAAAGLSSSAKDDAEEPAGSAESKDQAQASTQARSEGYGSAQIVRYVETVLCVKEAKSLGRSAFVAKYGRRGPMKVCRAAQQAAAQAIVDTATTACSGDLNPLVCLKRSIATAVGRPTGAPARP